MSKWNGLAAFLVMSVSEEETLPCQWKTPLGLRRSLGSCRGAQGPETGWWMDFLLLRVGKPLEVLKCGQGRAALLSFFVLVMAFLGDNWKRIELYLSLPVSVGGCWGAILGTEPRALHRTAKHSELHYPQLCFSLSF